MRSKWGISFKLNSGCDFQAGWCFSYQVGISLLLNLQGCTISFNLNSKCIFKPNEIILLSRFFTKWYLTICISYTFISSNLFVVQNTHDGTLSVPSCFQNTSAPWLLSTQVLTNHPHPWPASNEWGLRRHCCLFALIKEHHVHIYLEWEETHLITQGILFLTSYFTRLSRDDFYSILWENKCSSQWTTMLDTWNSIFNMLIPVRKNLRLNNEHEIKWILAKSRREIQLPDTFVNFINMSLKQKQF